MVTFGVNVENKVIGEFCCLHGFLLFTHLQISTDVNFKASCSNATFYADSKIVFVHCHVGDTFERLAGEGSLKILCSSHLDE